MLQRPPRACGTPGTILERVGGEGANRGVQIPRPSLLGMHMPVTDGCSPPTPWLRQPLASLWQDCPPGRDPPAHISKASPGAGEGTAHTSGVCSHSEWQRCR